MVPGRLMAGSQHMSDAGIFVRPCAEFRGLAIRSLSSRKFVASRNAPVVREPDTRHAQLALSDDLDGRHGALDTSPGTYRAACAPSSPRTSGRSMPRAPLWIHAWLLVRGFIDVGVSSPSPEEKNRSPARLSRHSRSIPLVA